MAKVKGWNGKRFKRFSSAVRALRLLRRMSQKRLAAAIGVEVEFLALTERNLRRPSMSLRRKLADVLRVSSEELNEIAWRDQPPPMRVPLFSIEHR